MKAFIGQRVRLSLHPDATIWIVKKIDTLNEAVWLVAADGSGDICGWVSDGSLYSALVG